VGRATDARAVTGYFPGHSGVAAVTIGAAMTMTVAGFADSGTMTADFTVGHVTAGRRWPQLHRLPGGELHRMAVGGGDRRSGPPRTRLPWVATSSACLPRTERSSAIAVAFVFINLGFGMHTLPLQRRRGVEPHHRQQDAAADSDLGAIGLVAAVAGCGLCSELLNISSYRARLCRDYR